MRGKSFAIKQGKKLATKYFPEPSTITKENLFSLAPDLDNIASDLNVTIIDYNFSDEVSGVFVREHNNYYIGVNKNHHPHRKRFTIAHEIGHHVLHSTDTLHYDTTNLDAPNIVLYRANEQNSYNEVEANAFAAELLMPDSIIDKCVQLEILSIDKLAEIFQVSTEAMRYRLTNLGYI